jgi:hypothetical protein
MNRMASVAVRQFINATLAEPPQLRGGFGPPRQVPALPAVRKAYVHLADQGAGVAVVVGCEGNDAATRICVAVVVSVAEAEASEVEAEPGSDELREWLNRRALAVHLALVGQGPLDALMVDLPLPPGFMPL